MKNYLDFEKEIKALEQEIDGLKSPFGSEGITEVDTNKIKNTQQEINKIQGENGIWFAGAWLGNGFHEDGFESAINISKKFNSLPEWLK